MAKRKNLIPIPKLDPTTIENLWRKIRFDEGDKCWRWLGRFDGDGRGMVAINKRNFVVARVIYTLTKGPIPQGMLVLHSCDNPICVNPNHLFLGTDGDNTQDKVGKGRAYRPAKLTETQVREIRKRYVPWKVSTHTLAREYGVTPANIRAIIHRRSWKHVV